MGAGNPCRILAVFVISFQNTRTNIGQLESPSLTAFDPFAGCNDLFDLAARVENTNFTAAEFRAARFSLRFHGHWCPDVSGVVKLARLPIRHPDASM
jgi:hypothetical protein